MRHDFAMGYCSVDLYCCLLLLFIRPSGHHADNEFAMGYSSVDLCCCYCLSGHQVITQTLNLPWVTVQFTFVVVVVYQATRSSRRH